MAIKKSKDGYGKVNTENISGKAVPRKGGRTDQRRNGPKTGMSVNTAFKQATFGSPNLPQTGNGLQGAMSAGAKARRAGRGGRGPTLRGGIGG